MTFDDALKALRKTNPGIFVISGFEFDDKYYFFTTSSKKVYETGKFISAIFFIPKTGGSFENSSLINLCCEFGEPKEIQFSIAASDAVKIDAK